MESSKSNKSLSKKEITGKLSSLFKENELKLCLLFGSLSTGKLHKKSDIDLAFLFENSVDIIGITNRVINLLKTDNIDVVDLKRASPLLKYAIAKTGIVLYEKSPGIFNEFCSLSFRLYIDSKKLRSAQQEVINNFLIEKELR